MARALDDITSAKRDEEEFLARLLKTALAQNPDLAHEFAEIERRKLEAQSSLRKERIAMYQKWKKEQDAKLEPRKIRYNDRLNKNKLSALRRSNDYKYSTRERQIEMELRYYYDEMNLERPKELLEEIEELRRAKISSVAQKKEQVKRGERKRGEHCNQQEMPLERLA